MAHLLKDNKTCGLCHQPIRNNTSVRYMHKPENCAYYHANLLPKETGNNEVEIVKSATNVVVGGSTLAVVGGRLAVVGKVGQITGKVLGGALAAAGFVTGVLDIVQTLKEGPTPLDKCEYCGRKEAEQPGCRCFCKDCGETDCWTDGTEEKHCMEICEECFPFNFCFNCKKEPSHFCHLPSQLFSHHGSMNTYLYGTNKPGKITGNALSMAGGAAMFVPGVGWVLGPALIAAGIGTTIVSEKKSDPYQTIKCESCDYEEKPEEFFNSEGCKEFCLTCGEEPKRENRFCFRLCISCKENGVSEWAQMLQDE